MSFYKSIANYYNYIFPPNQLQAEFIKSSLPVEQCNNVLDIGCGTGNLSFQIAQFAKNVAGIDLDSEMLSIANDINKKENKQIKFYNMNMLDIKNNFDKDQFDLIASFGNTLVHLNNIDEVCDFFEQTKYILKPNGKLLLQIINYDRIIENKIDYLPTIENEYIKFQRDYIYHKQIRKIDFNTTLTVKKDDLIIKNSVSLFPILKEEITTILLNCGYHKIKIYSNFKRKEHSTESIPTIIEATK